jgi:hypothetical protein
VLKVQLAQQARKALKVQLVLKAQLAQLVLKVLKVRPVLKDQQVQPHIQYLTQMVLLLGFYWALGQQDNLARNC